MKIMIFKTRVEHLENVLNEIGNSNLYEYPHVDFVLVKEINGKDYYTAGISNEINPDESFLFRPKARAKSIPIQNLRYEKHNIYFYQSFLERQMFLAEDKCEKRYERSF